jgi:ubiquinone/menaquinone biosynthesis C-methylase UbiE
VHDAVDEHYAHIARSYDHTWSHRPDYQSWMRGHIAARLPMSPGRRLADIGAGTGLFLAHLVERADARTPILCVDPSEAMLAQLPDDPRLRPLRATAEEVATGDTALPYDEVDAILVKETIHHVTDLATTVKGLAEQLAPHGRMLVVTLPPRLEYPLFDTALDRFAAGHPEPEDIAAHMRQAGLTAVCEYDAFRVAVDRDHWAELVTNRWMSVLSSFTDAELADGVAEIRRRHAPGELRFADRFAFVLGTKPGR